MTIIELLVLAVGLSMDAFAISVCKGLSVGKIKPVHCAVAGAWFGGFQGLMPLIGYFLGAAFASYIQKFDHWVAFVLLFIIGGNMLREAFFGGEEDECDCGCHNPMSAKAMLPMAFATSVDALAVGITFAFLAPSIGVFWGCAVICAVTFVFSAVGVKIGSVFGAKYKKKATVVGGAALCLLGLKILLQHLGVINF